MTERSWRVTAITTDRTHAIRRAVLRADTPTKEVRFAEDDLPGVVHLGALEDGQLIATSTWIPRESHLRPGVPAVQLRGMATLQSAQSRGVGASLVAAGLDHARSIGAELVWANARDAALAFYVREGFSVVGDGFVDAATQLPHHVVIISLA
ncbi:MAG: hypothetical protein RI958_2791 [Actinomycetota bacterium]